LVLSASVPSAMQRRTTSPNALCGCITGVTRYFKHGDKSGQRREEGASSQLKRVNECALIVGAFQGFFKIHGTTRPQAPHKVLSWGYKTVLNCNPCPSLTSSGSGVDELTDCKCVAGYKGVAGGLARGVRQGATRPRAYIRPGGGAFLNVEVILYIVTLSHLP